MNPSSFHYKTVAAVAMLCAFAQGPSQIGRQDQINWRTYRQGAFSSAKGQLTNVFETEGQFQTYWDRVNGPIAGKFPTGNIDWAKEKLIAVNLGSRANPGYEVVIQSVKRIRAGEIQVLFQEQLPMRGVSYPQVMVSPWVIVKMERAPGIISFKGETVSRSTGIIAGPGTRDCCFPICRCCENCRCCGDH